MSWAARPSKLFVPGHVNRAQEGEALLDRVDLLSSMPRASKASDTDAISDTTADDDPHLQLSLLAGVEYDILGMLIVEGATAADLKIQWAWTPASTGTELNIGGIGSTAGVTTFEGDGIFLHRADVTSSPTATTTVGTNTATWVNYLVCGNIVVGVDNITFKLQWAQNASSITQTRIKAKSWLRAWPAYT